MSSKYCKVGLKKCCINAVRLTFTIAPPPPPPPPPPQEQYIPGAQSLHLQRPPGPGDVIYTVGLCGWRKRCLYFLLLLFLVTMIINLALTVWIIKVMNLSAVRAAPAYTGNTGPWHTGRSSVRMMWRTSLGI